MIFIIQKQNSSFGNLYSNLDFLIRTIREGWQLCNYLRQRERERESSRERVQKLCINPKTDVNTFQHELSVLDAKTVKTSVVWWWTQTNDLYKISPRETLEIQVTVIEVSCENVRIKSERSPPGSSFL